MPIPKSPFMPPFFFGSIKGHLQTTTMKTSVKTKVHGYLNCFGVPEKVDELLKTLDGIYKQYAAVDEKGKIKVMHQMFAEVNKFVRGLGSMMMPYDLSNLEEAIFDAFNETK